MHNNTIIHYGK